MELKKIFLLAFAGLMGIPTFSQVINCPSGFNENTSGACSIGPGSGSSQDWFSRTLNSGDTGLNGTAAIITPANSGHAGWGFIRQAKVNDLAFTAHWQFKQNALNHAFVIENQTNQNGQAFTAGAGDEAGYFQGANGGNISPNFVWGMKFDSYQPLTTGSFTYSSVIQTQTLQSPVRPPTGGTNYIPEYQTNAISTSPVPLNSPPGTQETTTGDVYDATVNYDHGTGTLTLALYDVTAGGTCTPTSSSTCFFHTWTGVWIPEIVGASTAWVGFTAGTSGGGTISPYENDILNFTYTVNTPSSGPPSFTAWNSNSSINNGVPSAYSPVYSVAPGTYSSAQTVTMTTSGSPNNYICYLTSANTPALYPQPDNNGGCAVGTLNNWSIVSYSTSGSTATFTLPTTITWAGAIAGTVPTVGQQMTLSNFTGSTNTFLNGQTITVSANNAGSGTFTATVTGASGNPSGSGQMATGSSTGVTISSTTTLYAMAGSNDSAFTNGGSTNQTGLGPPSTLVAGTYTINPCTISSGASSATIVSTISGCASGNTVTFAAGTYSLSSSATVPCGVSIAGPTVALAQYTAGDGYARYGYAPTAIINWTGSAPGIMFNRGACSTTASINYIECNMNQPSGGGGQCVYNGAVTSNFSELGDYFHGNQANASSGSSTADSLDYFDGDGSTTDTNISITWSRFGASGDCSNIMNVHTNFSGSCNGVGFHNSASNLTINNNFFYYNENELKFYEGCSYSSDSQTTCTPASGMEKCLTCTVQYNDFSNFHRIGFETQANYRPVSSGSPSVSMLIQYNSLHDPYYPSGITFGISSANGCDNTNPSPGGCVTNTDANVIIDNVAASSGNLADGIEQWGATGSTANNNLIQGEWANSIIINKDGAFSDYGNLIQSSYGAAGSNTPADCYPAFFGAFGWWGVSNSPVNTPVPTSAGGTNANTCNFFDGSVQTSATPAIAPASQTFTTSQAWTVTNSGTNRDTNTGLWCTTNGSSPVPGSGSTLYYANGTGGTVTSTTTIQCVGMWGALNQPLTYPTGPLSGTFGYQPSSVQSATYTKGSGSLAAPSGVSVIVISKNDQGTDDKESADE